MFTDHDRLFKELLTTFFAEFLQLFLPEISAYVDESSITFLDKEFFTDVTRGERSEADLVARVSMRGKDTFFLIHVEHQAQSQSAFPARMFRYFARLHELHDLPIYPIALFSYVSPAREEPTEYRVEFPDKLVLSFQFSAIQLNRLSWRSYVRNPNPVASALMARMQIDDADRAQVKLECLRLMASLRLDRARSHLISGFVDTYLNLNEVELVQFGNYLAELNQEEESQVLEITTSWKEEGRAQGRAEGQAQGRAEGQAQGRAEGRVEGLRLGCETALEIAFGAEGLGLVPLLREADLELLQEFRGGLKAGKTVAQLRQLLSK